MTPTLHQALGETLEYLIALDSQQIAPKPAIEGLALLRARHPKLALDLVWQREPSDLHRSYDALLRDGERGTVSISWSPERSIPFPLRGLQRASENELVRVNGESLKIHEAMEALEFLWGSVRLVDRVIDTCIVKAAVLADPIEIEDEELAHAMDGFRSARKLHSIVETERWMKQRGLTHEMLEAIVSDELRLTKLRSRVTETEVERRLRERSADFDRAELLYFEVLSEARALTLAQDIEAGRADFYSAAEQVLRERSRASTGGNGIQISNYFRSQLIFPAEFPISPEVGRVTAVRIAERPFSVARVISWNRAASDSAIREEVAEIVFEEWLALRRQEAKIEWNWGNEAEDQ